MCEIQYSVSCGAWQAYMGAALLRYTCVGRVEAPIANCVPGFCCGLGRWQSELDVLVQGVCQCIVEILEGRSWGTAFVEDTGLIGTQADVSQRVRLKLSFEHTPDVGSDLSTLA